MNSTQPGSEGAKCPGSISVSTSSEPLHIQMTNAYWNLPGDPAGNVEVDNGVITVHMRLGKQAKARALLRSWLDTNDKQVYTLS